MAVVLAIEPDLRQAAILKRIVREKVKADLIVVDSRDAAVDAIARGVPDVVLLSALMSPRDEDELIQRLRSLKDADHLQTHTIPQLSSSLEDHPPSKARGLLSAFRRKKEPEVASGGCDPDLFADEIKTFIKSAAAKKEERRAIIESGQFAATAAARATAAALPQPEAPVESGSSWDDPFAWRPSPASNPQAPTSNAQEPAPREEPQIAAPVSDVEPVSEPDQPAVAEPDQPAVAAAAVAAEPDQPPVASEAPDPWATDYRPVGVGPTAHAEIPTPTHDVDINTVVAALVDHRQITVPTAVEPEVEVAEIAEPAPIADVPLSTREEVVEITATPPEPEPEPEPVAAAPQPALPRTLGPLATWVRFEVTAAKGDPKTTSDELRDLMAHLSIPPHVAGVSYARGCRIRRVRVLGGRDRRKTSVPGPVILSRRQLERERETST